MEVEASKRGIDMKEGSWEWYYYDTNPSPFDGLVFWCRALRCELVMPYHGKKWRKATEEDYRWYREHGGFNTFCLEHWKLLQRLQEEQTEDDLE